MNASRTYTQCVLALALACASGCIDQTFLIDETGRDDSGGHFGEQCVNGIACDLGLVCVTGDSDSSVCADPSDSESCDNGMIADTDSRVVDGGCVAACQQFSDDCGTGYQCVPADALAVGFCAPI